MHNTPGSLDMIVTLRKPNPAYIDQAKTECSYNLHDNLATVTLKFSKV